MKDLIGKAVSGSLIFAGFLEDLFSTVIKIYHSECGGNQIAV